MSKSDRQRRWSIRALHQMERRIDEKGLSIEEEAIIAADLAGIVYYMLDDMEKTPK